MRMLQMQPEPMPYSPPPMPEYQDPGEMPYPEPPMDVYAGDALMGEFQRFVDEAAHAEELRVLSKAGKHGLDKVLEDAIYEDDAFSRLAGALRAERARASSNIGDEAFSRLAARLRAGAARGA
jgi:hypothetical protein